MATVRRPIEGVAALATGGRPEILWDRCRHEPGRRGWSMGQARPQDRIGSSVTMQAMVAWADG